MAYDLIDRRNVAASPGRWEDEEDGASEAAGRLWRSLGFEVSGSPELADHDAARLLIQAAAERLAAGLERPTTVSTRRWRTAAGESARTITRPSRSTRDGSQRDPVRNIRAYLLVEVLGLSGSELGRELGIAKSSARAAAEAGRRSVAAVSARRTDPRRPAASGRPLGRNERPW